jgi:dTDP-4-dehydrorhamnose 3,5-epimerase
VRYLPLGDNPDERGHFREIFRAADFSESFVQANHSKSEAGVLRGLHYHRKQADLWYVVGGEALVACVDLRSAPTPGRVWTGLLSEGDPAAIFIPPGVAHGFFARTRVDLVYWVTRTYDATDEFGVAWNDPSLDIDWGVQDPILSERDAANERIDWARIKPF